MDGQYLIKFCLYYIIDKIYVFIEKGHFLQICNRVTALDLCQKLFLLNTLRMDGQNLTKFCFVYTLLLTRSGLVLYFFFIFATELQPLIYIEIGVCSIS